MAFWYFTAVIYLMLYIGKLINIESSKDNSIFIIILFTSFLFLLASAILTSNFKTFVVILCMLLIFLPSLSHKVYSVPFLDIIYCLLFNSLSSFVNHFFFVLVSLHFGTSIIFILNVPFDKLLVLFLFASDEYILRGRAGVCCFGL